MTLEEENELLCLSILFKKYTAGETHFKAAEVLFLLNEELWSPEFTAKIFRQLCIKGYLELDENAGVVINPNGSRTETLADRKYYLSKYGIKVYLHMATEKEKSDIDYKVKQITVGNSWFQRWVPIFSLLVAAFSVGATIYIAKTKAERPYLSVEEFQRLQVEQQQVNKSIRNLAETLKVYYSELEMLPK